MVLPHSFFDGTASKTEAASLTEPYTEKMNPTPSFFTASVSTVLTSVLWYYPSVFTLQTFGFRGSVYEVV